MPYAHMTILNNCINAVGMGFRHIPRHTMLTVTSSVMLVAIYMSFIYAPRDANLGDVQRILYIHVPIAILALSGFALVMVGSLTYLVRRQPRWDAFAHASAQVGLLFASITLITGAIWAKPVWGVWWTWDPKLTTTLILWLIYVAYLMLRAYAPGDKGARFAAVLGIMGFVDTPIIYLAKFFLPNNSNE